MFLFQEVDVVKPQIIMGSDGQPAYAVIPWAEYEQLTVALASDEELYDAAKARGEEAFPISLVDRLMAGDSPIKVYREYRGLTQKELAVAAGITPVYLSQIETGVRQGSAKVLANLAQALAISLDDLV